MYVFQEHKYIIAGAMGETVAWEEGVKQPGKDAEGNEKGLPEIVSRIDSGCAVKRGK